MPLSSFWEDKDCCLERDNKRSSTKNRPSEFCGISYIIGPWTLKAVIAWALKQWCGWKGPWPTVAHSNIPMELQKGWMIFHLCEEGSLLDSHRELTRQDSCCSEEISNIPLQQPRLCNSKASNTAPHKAECSGLGLHLLRVSRRV